MRFDGNEKSVDDVDVENDSVRFAIEFAVSVEGIGKVRLITW